VFRINHQPSGKADEPGANLEAETAAAKQPTVAYTKEKEKEDPHPIPRRPLLSGSITVTSSSRIQFTVVARAAARPKMGGRKKREGGRSWEVNVPQTAATALGNDD